MMPSNEKVSKAMRVLDGLRVSDGSTMSERDGWFEALRVLYDVAQLHLQSASELPEVFGKADENIPDDKEEAYRLGVKDAFIEVTPILTRKNEEVALLKKENEELEQELEACRDANVQKKKRISELEDALKRAEEIPSVEEIQKELPDMLSEAQVETIPNSALYDIDVKKLANLIHALLTTRGKES